MRGRRGDAGAIGGGLLSVAGFIFENYASIVIDRLPMFFDGLKTKGTPEGALVFLGRLFLASAAALLGFFQVAHALFLHPALLFLRRPLLLDNGVIPRLFRPGAGHSLVRHIRGRRPLLSENRFGNADHAHDTADRGDPESVPDSSRKRS